MEKLQENISILEKRKGWEGSSNYNNLESYSQSVEKNEKKLKKEFNSLLNEIKKEKNLKTFQEKLKKISEEEKEKIEKKVEEFEKIFKETQIEIKSDIPFLSTFPGMIISTIISEIICYLIFDRYAIEKLSKKKDCCPKDENDMCISLKEENKLEKKALCHCLRCDNIWVFFNALYAVIEMLIFPFLNGILVMDKRIPERIIVYRMNNVYKDLFYFFIFCLLNAFLAQKLFSNHEQSE